MQENMQQKIGTILLIAGICIGSGMIALPMLLAKLGLIPSICLILVIWALTYYASLVTVELQISSGKALSIGELGKHFAGNGAQNIGAITLKLLSYSLCAVYLYGSASILQKLFNTEVTINHIALYCAIGTSLVLLLSIKIVDYINRILFLGLLGIFSMLLIALVATMNWQNLPLFSENYANLNSWSLIIPVIFTSFGFQGSMHTISSYCNINGKTLRKAICLGTLIPAIVYIIWSGSAMSVIYDQDPVFYKQMAMGEKEVGDLIQKLTVISQWHSMQLIVWWISLLAILTSLLGVGAGLSDSLRNIISNTITIRWQRNVIAVFATIFPSYIVASMVPNAFILVLGFAGMILAMIAILLPLYLLHKSKIEATKLYFQFLSVKFVLGIMAVAGIIVVGCEIWNMTQ